MAILKIETTVSVVKDVNTDDFDPDFTIEDILGHFQNLSKETITDSLDDEDANFSVRVFEMTHASHGS